MKPLIIIALLLVPAIVPLVPVFAQTCPDNEVWNEDWDRCISCMELGSCAFTTDPLGTMLIPFDVIFSGLSIIVFWGLMISIVWLRTQNPMLVGILGVAMTASYMTVAPEPLPNEFDGARIIGGSLLAVSIGIAIYHLISSRIYQPPQ